MHTFWITLQLCYKRHHWIFLIQILYSTLHITYSTSHIPYPTSHIKYISHAYCISKLPFLIILGDHLKNWNLIFVSTIIYSNFVRAIISRFNELVRVLFSHRKKHWPKVNTRMSGTHGNTRMVSQNNEQIHSCPVSI